MATANNPIGLWDALRFGDPRPHGGPDRVDADARHYIYAAKQHEKGNNAWNPFGGMLTPSPYERGASKGLLGEFGASKVSSVKLASPLTEALKGFGLAAAPGAVAGGALGLSFPKQKEDEWYSRPLRGLAGAGLGGALTASIMAPEVAMDYMDASRNQRLDAGIAARAAQYTGPRPTPGGSFIPRTEMQTAAGQRAVDRAARQLEEEIAANPPGALRDAGRRLRESEDAIRGLGRPASPAQPAPSRFSLLEAEDRFPPPPERQSPPPRVLGPRSNRPAPAPRPTAPEPLSPDPNDWMSKIEVD